jgi:two-component system phosphate regulon response regulator PhoB
MHIVVVEDEKDILEIIEYNLLRDGYQVSTAMDGISGLDMVRREKPDLVLLDLMLPKMDGLELCKVLKSESMTRSIPIIVVTAREEENDVVSGLDLGADDYVTKPFSTKELLARVHSVLRRVGKIDQQDSKLVLGPLKIIPDEFSIQVDGESIDLTKTEFRLLQTLASQPGRVFSRDQLLHSAVGEKVVVTDRNIDVHIRAIRKALGEHGKLIETVRGVGYRFTTKFN